jgi:hypothetical protein
MTEDIPHSEPSEKYVLSSLMKEPALLESHRLDPDAFHLPAHSAIYRRMIAIGETDAVILAQDFLDRNQLDYIGGGGTIGDLINHAVGPHFDHHLGVVLDRHKRRRAAEVGRRIIEAATDCGNSSGYVDAMGKPIEEVIAMGGGNSNGTSRRIADIAGRTLVKMADYENVASVNARSLLPRCIWDSILREGCLGILGGESKAKKSWFSLAFAMHAVSCAPFLGIAIPPPLEGNRRVVILDYELLESNVMSRFISLAEKFDQDDEAWRAVWDRVEIRCHRSMLAEDVDWIAYCVAVVRQCNRGDVVIVDCLQALPAGDANDPQAVRRVLGRLQSAATDSGACVVIVDHFSKSTEARGMNRISGSMAKAATPDAILLLESDGKFIKFSTELRMDPPRDPLTLEFRSPSEGFRVVGEEEREERKEGAKAKRESERLAVMFPEVGRDYTLKELAVNIGKTTKTAEGWMNYFPEFITTKEGTGKTPHLYSRKL